MTVSIQLRYLKSALNALSLFSVPSSEGGFLASFLGRVPWYEEYPTDPPTFVLNGFMYSLMGLVDLRDLMTEEEMTGSPNYETVSELFAQVRRIYDLCCVWW